MYNDALEIIIGIIFFILYLLFGGGRRRRSYFRIYGDYYNGGLNAYNVPRQPSRRGIWLRNSIRRFFAVRKCKRFLKKNKSIYTLENLNVKFIFDSKLLDIKCNNRARRNEYFSCNFETKITTDFNDFEDPRDYIQECFDNICSGFDEKTTYTGIRDFFVQHYKLQESKRETKPKTVKLNLPEMAKKKDILYVDDYVEKEKIYFPPQEQVNINSASVEDISKLPGINIVMAKKIIKYRDLNNGFNSKEDFYEKMDIKPHFIKQIDNLIVVVKPENQGYNDDDDTDRIVDL